MGRTARSRSGPRRVRPGRTWCRPRGAARRAARTAPRRDVLPYVREGRQEARRLEEFGLGLLRGELFHQLDRERAVGRALQDADVVAAREGRCDRAGLHTRQRDDGVLALDLPGLDCGVAEVAADRHPGLARGERGDRVVAAHARALGGRTVVVAEEGRVRLDAFSAPAGCRCRRRTNRPCRSRAHRRWPRRTASRRRCRRRRRRARRGRASRPVSRGRWRPVRPSSSGWTGRVPRRRPCGSTARGRRRRRGRRRPCRRPSPTAWPSGRCTRPSLQFTELLRDVEDSAVLHIAGRVGVAVLHHVGSGGGVVEGGLDALAAVVDRDVLDVDLGALVGLLEGGDDRVRRPSPWGCCRPPGRATRGACRSSRPCRRRSSWRSGGRRRWRGERRGR
ncbi:hypothetical protein SVIOM74S_08266 [Streptomyces violarus]